MPVQRLNHAVLYVRDVARSVDFYTGALEFRVVARMGGKAAFLQAAGSTNDHDLGLFEVGAEAGDSPAGRGTVGLYHLAWEVDTLAELRRIREALVERGALVGASDHGSTKALYARDPDGIEFEVSWLVPADLLGEGTGMRTAALDLDAEIARYGADTPGGIGVSVAAR
ncbi:VOC family protein [Pseudonocardia lacus]|uniref:VOC family protein n=1 Tax=Pseudonocardia lacus TaxID=2835865 RepID=UPI001BDC10C5|nr:VOC family protein [Pseudonocardia lacus]